MKKLLVFLFAISLLLTSCGKKTEEGTHTHEDGTTHAGHGTPEDQEKFNPSDSTEHEHQHDSTDHTHE